MRTDVWYGSEWEGERLPAAARYFAAQAGPREPKENGSDRGAAVRLERAVGRREERRCPHFAREAGAGSGSRRAAIINGFDPTAMRGGIESFVSSLGRLLEKRGFRVDVVFPPFRVETARRPSKARMAADRAFPPFLRECFRFGRRFRGTARAYDLVVSGNFYGCGLVGRGPGYVNVYHSTHAGYADAVRDFVPAWYHRQLKYACGYFGDVLGGLGKRKIAVSAGVRDELRRYYGFRDALVVPHGVDTRFFAKVCGSDLRARYGIPGPMPCGVYVGRWEEGKGVGTLSALAAAFADVHWVFALAVPDARALAARRPNVTVVEDAPAETVRDLLSLADFFVFPSLYEGFGLVLTEALACETPVVCTDVGVAKEWRDDPELGPFVIPRASGANLAAQFKERVRRLAADPALRRELGAAGRRLAERRFGLDAWEAAMDRALGIQPEAPGFSR